MTILLNYPIKVFQIKKMKKNNNSVLNHKKD
jgi:hypothetical protein